MGEGNSGIRDAFKPLAFLKYLASDNESYVNCMFPTASDEACPSCNYAEEVEEADPAFKPLIIALSMPSNTSNHILVPTRYPGWKPLLQMTPLRIKWIPDSFWLVLVQFRAGEAYLQLADSDRLLLLRIYIPGAGYNCFVAIYLGRPTSHLIEVVVRNRFGNDRKIKVHPHP